MITLEEGETDPMRFGEVAKSIRHRLVATRE
jgi:hypothetical protein